TRLGRQFETIYRHFQRLYGHLPEFDQHVSHLTQVLRNAHIARSPELRRKDQERVHNPRWLLSNRWVATMLYVDRYAENLSGFSGKIDYLQQLGINYVHLMPLLKSPDGENDGGYAVSDYRTVNPSLGTMADIENLAKQLHERDMIMELDLVLNHTADDHEWAQKALAGDPEYQEYYYMYPDRVLPDEYEKTLSEVFPEIAPGNFTYLESIDKWVFTSFNTFQWDLNYTNPKVFIEMLDILLFLANRGIDIMRLDAVPFLWKRIGTNSLNEPEAHVILQLLKACVKVAAPGVAFKSEAIVQPLDIIKYLGSAERGSGECDIAYNASLMVFLWDAVATKNCRLLCKGLENMPRIPDGTTWINYIRCHDDIGLGFADADVRQIGADPQKHRQFMIRYFTEGYLGSSARGEKFMLNPKTGDARISGSLASLAGLEAAQEWNSDQERELAVRRIIQLHAVIMSIGGIPLIYYGDELAMINDYSYKGDPKLAFDNRWMHRPVMDWNRARRAQQGEGVEGRIYQAIKKMIAVRRTLMEFNGNDDYQMCWTGNEHVFAYLREYQQYRTLVLMNFSDQPQRVSVNVLMRAGMNGA
ncbi:MAG: alpha-amylase, partial [Spartobacteria bacterium]|nr:alpha-amylase [Spartobacteria bacterium]